MKYAIKGAFIGFIVLSSFLCHPVKSLGDVYIYMIAGALFALYYAMNKDVFILKKKNSTCPLEVERERPCL